MELGLSLGEAFTAAEKAAVAAPEVGRGLGLGLRVEFVRRDSEEEEDEEEEDDKEEGEGEGTSSLEPSPALKLSLLPFSPVPARAGLPWASRESRNAEAVTRGFDVNRPPPSAEELEEPAVAVVFSSSLNSSICPLQRNFDRAVASGGGGAQAQPQATASGDQLERAMSWRGSDEEENGAARKKLRLSKDQSAFLEESFKEHNTLNPKQKLALAKQLNLRPRQVEVWFQNRRARTKLKQTEVDCEYLKRCCETLTEENRRLQKELSELRALKTANPFFMHLPATTLSMCPSCERVASTTTATTMSTAASPAADAVDHRPSSFAALFSKPRPFPFVSPQPAAAPPSTTS